MSVTLNPYHVLTFVPWLTDVASSVVMFCVNVLVTWIKLESAYKAHSIIQSIFTAIVVFIFFPEIPQARSPD